MPIVVTGRKYKLTRDRQETKGPLQLAVGDGAKMHILCEQRFVLYAAAVADTGT